MQNMNDIKKGLADLVKTFSKKGTIIIPIARRGIRIIELESTSQKLFENGMILFYDSIIFHSSELKNKRLILFDEAVNSGKTLHRLKKKLQRFSVDNKLNLERKIFTASLFVNQDAKYFPDYYPRDLLVSNDLYDRLSEELHYEILSTGKPMDVDHLIGKIEFREKQENFIKIIKTNYNAIETGHSRRYEDVVMLTIDFSIPNAKIPFQFDIPNISKFPNLFDDGPRKFRLYIKGNVAYLVPIVYPVMEIDENITEIKKQCPLLEIFKNRALCKVLIENGIKDQKSQSLICYNCITNELSTNLLCKFLVDLQKHINFKFSGLDDKGIQVVSHKESIDIIRILEKNIRKSVEENEYTPTLIGKKVDKCEFKGVKINKEISTIKGDYIKLEINENNGKKMIKLRPEIEIATAVNVNKNVNKALIDKGEYSGLDIEPEGLSYNQIRMMMNNMNELRFSEGMDVALDVGYLKPIIQFKGIKIFSGKKYYQTIARLYTTASEDVTESLECYLRLITPGR